MTEISPPADDIPPPNFDSFPCTGEADVAELMEAALPCRCGSRHLLPASDLGYPPTLAIVCLDCDEVWGFAGTLAAAITNWNAWTRALPGRHAWVPTESDAGEVCCLCGAEAADVADPNASCSDYIPPIAEPPGSGEEPAD